METETATRWLTDTEQRTWRVHLEANRLLMYQLEKDLQPFGLTMNDYEILVNLSESAELRMRMSDLAAATLQSKSDTDRRGLFAVLTEHGLETMQKVAPHHVDSVRRHFIDLLPPEALAGLRAALQPVAEHLRRQRGR